MTFRSLFLLGLWLTSLAAAPLRAGEALEPRRLEGEIAGARWIAIVPDDWNGRLLLEAPDRRHIPDPLVAELDAATPDHQALLAALPPGIPAACAVLCTSEGSARRGGQHAQPFTAPGRCLDRWIFHDWLAPGRKALEHGSAPAFHPHA